MTGPGNRRPGDASIDSAHLATQTSGDKALEREVLDLFLSHSTSQLALLRRKPDAAARSGAAHAIRGAALGVGAWAVAECAGRVEADGGDAALDELEAAVEAARRHIAELSAG